MPSNPPPPYAIGLVGGIAAGKSFVARALADLGAEVIDADALAHEVLKQPLVVRRVSMVFGPEVLNEQGQLDRSELAERVFGNEAHTSLAREELEAIVHPLVHAAAIRALRAYREQPQPPLAVVVDAPLLLEAGWAPMCDLILFVDTPTELRCQRAEERGWTAEQFRLREESQMSVNEKRAQATHVVTGESTEELLPQLRAIWQKLQK